MSAIRPVHLHDTGLEVANLHKGLSLLLLHEPGISDNDRKTLRQRLKSDVSTETFGAATADLVGIVQNQLKNWPKGWPALPAGLKAKVQNLPVSGGTGNGDVDEVTAEALNWLLKEF